VFLFSNSDSTTRVVMLSVAIRPRWVLDEDCRSLGDLRSIFDHSARPASLRPPALRENNIMPFERRATVTPRTIATTARRVVVKQDTLKNAVGTPNRTECSSR
jgi:hypothetical protein